MIKRNTKTTFVSKGQSRRAALFLGGLFLAGCGSKDTSASAPAASSASSGGAIAPTPAQEAAKQRGEEQGPAIQAANQAARGEK